MRKTNNRFRNGNNNHSNQIYSLNYKFDSNSVAGKCSGTALDLIKRYNELARDALNNSDRVGAEVFRQYAEHYRKIVTDINDKKNAKISAARDNRIEEDKDVSSEPKCINNDVPEVENSSTTEVLADDVKKPVKKSFKIVEVKEDKVVKAPRKPRVSKSVESDCAEVSVKPIRTKTATESSSEEIIAEVTTKTRKPRLSKRLDASVTAV